MPIKPENAKRYPANWKELRAAVLARAGNCCEGSPAYPDCRIGNGWFRNNTTGETCPPDSGLVTEAWELADGDSVTLIVLTIAHLEHDELETQDISRLRAWCQKCHLTYDAKHHAQISYHTRKSRKALGDFFTTKGETWKTEKQHRNTQQ